MDPYSAEGELINIHNHFHQGQFQEVVDYDTSALSSENELPAQLLQFRARIALGQAEDVVAETKGKKKPEYQAIHALAESSLGKTDSAVQTIEQLADTEGENATVQLVGGTVLQAAGKSEEALALLSKHSGSCRPPPPFALYFHRRDATDSRPTQWMPWPLSSRYTYSKTVTTSPSRK